MEKANQDALERFGEPALVLPAGWSAGPGPLHRHLTDAIEGLIRRGELREGTMLPTERDLAEAIAVSRATVAHAYRSLKAAGRIESRQGRGTWVAAGRTSGRGQQAEHLGPLLAPHTDLIDLALAAPSPMSDVRVEVGAGVARGAGSGVGYEPAGLPDLREAIAAHCSVVGLATTADQVLVTNGAQQAIGLAMSELVGPGDAVVVEESTYVGALDAARSVGARIIAVPTDGDGVDVDSLEVAVERHRPALVYLNPTHQTPTGTTLSAERRRRVVMLAVRAGVTVIDDGVLAGLGWADTADAAHLVSPLAALDRRAPILSIGSLSKVVWAGLRVGWVRGDRAVIDALTARRMVADLGGSIPVQVAAVELVESYAELCAARSVELKARHDHLVGALRAALPQWDVPAVDGGTVLWARLPAEADSEEFAAVASAHGVSVVAGPTVSVHGVGRDRLRVSFVAPIEVLDEGVARLDRAWADYGSSPRSRRVRPLLV